MSLLRLLFCNLLFHWRGNSAVVLGVAVGTAVLSGALLVGDSLRGSLQDLTLRQLEWVDHALVAGRFIRADLAGAIDAQRVVPALLLQGAISTGDESSTALPRRAGRVTVLGVDDRFWPAGQPPIETAFWKAEGPSRSGEAGVVLNDTLARDLSVAPGQSVVLHLQKTSVVPRESLLGRRDADSVLARLTFQVRAVLPEGAPGSRFSLKPSPAAPRNIFVPLRLLQERLDHAGRVNALLVEGGTTAGLQDNLHRLLTLDDWNLVLRTPESRAEDLTRQLQRDGDSKLTSAEVTAFKRKHQPYLSLESRQFLIEPAIAEAALQAARISGLRAAPTLVYLANTIAANEQKIPYAVVAALEPEQTPPLGPFLPPGVKHLENDDIVLAAWPESSLRVKPGDEVRLWYFEPVEGSQLRETSLTFRLRGLIPLEGPGDDPDLTPAFPGITDKLNLRDWDPPFPYDNKRIHKADEDYWRQHRTAPRAYVTLARGQQLWGSRFGRLTSIRLAPTPGEPPGLSRRDNTADAMVDTPSWEDQARDFSDRLLEVLRPEQGGLVFDAVRQRSLQAGRGGTDFGVLFLSFSSFLIAAALLLVGLLFRLNLDRRAGEVGLLLALGYRARTVRRLLLAEGVILAVVGGLLGSLAALAYARFLLELLAVLWPGGLERSFLRPHPTPSSLGIGFLAAVAISVLTILWALLGLRRVSPQVLLAGETTTPDLPSSGRRRIRWSPWIAGAAAVGGLGLLGWGWFVRDHEMQAAAFFGSGALLLMSCLAGTWTWMSGAHQGQVGGHGIAALALLGIRNAARHPVRSLLTAGLLASAAFLLVAVESFRRHADAGDLSPTSGSGGYALLAESDVPIFQDLNSEQGRAEISDALERRLRDRFQGTPQQFQEQLQQYRALLARISFVPFRVRAGDDASCLNLYQPRRPRLLGVPHSLIQRGGFRFAGSLAQSADERSNPWSLLNRSFDDGAIPVIGEANTVVWMLGSGLGKDIKVPDERGGQVRLRVVALLQDSVFQSGLLLSEANFLKLYPAQEGYSFFLIQTTTEHAEASILSFPDPQGHDVFLFQTPPVQRADFVKAVLETAMGQRGFEVTPTAERLEGYLAVENTYLTTFQALGGLGLFLGTLGLAVVLLRSIWERRGELALLRALGYRHRSLGWLLLAENSFLLLLGLGGGTLSALLAVAPHLLSSEGAVPWPRLVVLLAVVLLTGLLTIAVALAFTLRAPLLPALRRE